MNLWGGIDDLPKTEVVTVHPGFGSGNGCIILFLVSLCMDRLESSIIGHTMERARENESGNHRGCRGGTFDILPQIPSMHGVECFRLPFTIIVVLANVGELEKLRTLGIINKGMFSHFERAIGTRLV